MYTSQTSDLNLLIERYLPRDSDAAINAYLLEKWSKAITDADKVSVEWIESYGPKLRAAWINSEGRLLVSTASPPSRVESVQNFVRAWERYMRNHGRQPVIEWGENTSPLKS